MFTESFRCFRRWPQGHTTFDDLPIIRLPAMWRGKGCIAGIIALVCVASSGAAQQLSKTSSSELREPRVFTSSNGVLDLVIVARERVVRLHDTQLNAWVYQACLRKEAIGDTCPQSVTAESEYGGVRLQLQPGDHLKVRLVNQLPPAPGDATASQATQAMVVGNPTNLHTHGMIVEPRRATASNPTYGDYVYVMGYRTTTGVPMSMPAMDATSKPIAYDIAVPAQHTERA